MLAVHYKKLPNLLVGGGEDSCGGILGGEEWPFRQDGERLPEGSGV